MTVQCRSWLVYLKRQPMIVALGKIMQVFSITHETLQLMKSTLIHRSVLELLQGKKAVRQNLWRYVFQMFGVVYNMHDSIVFVIHFQSNRLSYDLSRIRNGKMVVRWLIWLTWLFLAIFDRNRRLWRITMRTTRHSWRRKRSVWVTSQILFAFLFVEMRDESWLIHCYEWFGEVCTVSHFVCGLLHRRKKQQWKRLAKLFLKGRKSNMPDTNKTTTTTTFDSCLSCRIIGSGICISLSGYLVTAVVVTSSMSHNHRKATLFAAGCFAAMGLARALMWLFLWKKFIYKYYCLIQSCCLMMTSCLEL